MGKRPRKKVILFLVEGKSDRIALELAFTELFESLDPNIEVFFPIIRDEDSYEAGGDITTEFGVWPRNIEQKIYDQFLYDFFDEMKLYPKDILEVIQIVDTDGAYIEDENVINSNERVRYTDDTIETFRRDSIINRNAQKRENLDYLNTLSEISLKQKKVKYSIYYFSTNLDHVLYGTANLSAYEKIPKAESFSSQYYGQAEKFIKWFIEADYAVPGDYAETWNFIKQDKNSLKRYTNINVLIERLISQSSKLSIIM